MKCIKRLALIVLTLAFLFSAPPRCMHPRLQFKGGEDFKRSTKPGEAKILPVNRIRYPGKESIVFFQPQLQSKKSLHPLRFCYQIDISNKLFTTFQSLINLFFTCLMLLNELRNVIY